jgi:hypothetical protein
LRRVATGSAAVAGLQQLGCNFSSCTNIFEVTAFYKRSKAIMYFL